MQKCRICYSNLTQELINLGKSPIANSFVPINKKDHTEKFLPLVVYICNKCFLAQIQEYVKPESIFNKNYAYFSSTSKSWTTHCEKYSINVMEKYNLNSKSHVVEIASNDGYLLQYFLKYNIKVTGVEPATNSATLAIKKNIYTENIFFNEKNSKVILKKRGPADLIIANNVLAHVPDIHDFIAGFKILLAEEGVITFEFPHLLKLIKYTQFDTIYHEHYSYLSINPLILLFTKHNLKIFDIEEISTHGGSLRIHVSHDKAKFKIKKSVKKVIEDEYNFGLTKEKTYIYFRKTVEKIKKETKDFFEKAKNDKKYIVGYGAPAKGNTFLNYCEINQNDIKFTVDNNIIKQNTLLPGTKIPVYESEKLEKIQADYIFILPWNLKEEIIKQIKSKLNYKVKFITAIPKLKIFS